jgi:8-amino-7-oxononanoate synthase
MLTPKIENHLRHWYNDNLLRERFTVDERIDNNIVINKKHFLNFSGNDYLGMTTHPKVVQAFMQGVQKYGIGSGASALVSGFHHPHKMLEEKFAEFMGCDRALLFSSGHLANLGVLTTLAGRQDTIISDRLCHASILAGIQLSRAKHKRFKHNDVAHAKNLLAVTSNEKFLITESVFGMSGEIAPIDQLAVAAKQYASSLIIDDAHGFGVLGKMGRGVSEHFGLTQADFTCQVTPMGKAFGSMGGLVSGKKVVIEALLQFATTYRYATALPPAMAYAAIATLEVIQEETWRREKLTYLIKYFIQSAEAMGLALIAKDLTPIKAILIADNKRAMHIKNQLMRAGIFVSCIRPPTVAKNTARIRISLNCLHEEEDIDHLLNVLVAAHAIPID